MVGLVEGIEINLMGAALGVEVCRQAKPSAFQAWDVSVPNFSYMVPIKLGACPVRQTKRS
jgi:hypothetical protein